MNIDKTVKDLNNYFIERILDNCPFKINSEHTITFTVDEKYTFTIWIANGANYLECYPSATDPLSFMDLNFTAQQRTRLWDKLKHVIEKYKKDVLIKELKDKLERLEQ